MLLFVRKGCDFCKGLPKVGGLTTFEVSQTPQGPKIMVEGVLVPLPAEIRGLPALKDENTIVMGKNLVRDHLEKKAKATGD
jgi:hypothetical protein